MKRKIGILVTGLAMSIVGMSQFDASQLAIGAAGNYTMYKGNFQKSTPGVKVEVSYGLKEKLSYALGYTKGFAINTPSTIESRNGVGNTKTTASTIKTSFSTISLMAMYRFVGDENSSFSLYAPIGASYVSANMKEEATETIPTGYTASNQMENTKESGFTLNAAIGFGYKVGVPQIFAEAGVAIPANKVGNSYVDNYIPLHFGINAGIRIPFGRGEE